MKIVNDNLIKKWEKLRLTAYLPTPNDVWTIGWGHTHTTKKGMTIDLAEAERLFDKDVAWVEAAIRKHVKVPLKQHQYDALASWIFNLGEANLASSTLLRKLNAKDYEGAAREFPRWNKQGKKVLKGLVRRRAEEMEYFLHPVEGDGQVPDAVEPLKPIVQSKEAIGGSLAAILALVGVYLPDLPYGAPKALLWAVGVIGVALVANRLYARWRGER